MNLSLEKENEELKNITSIYEKNTQRLEKLLYEYQVNEPIIKDVSSWKLYNRKLKEINSSDDISWASLPDLDYDISRHENTKLEKLELVYDDTKINIEVQSLKFSKNYLTAINPIWWDSDVDEECPTSAILRNIDGQYNLISNWKINMKNWWNHILSFSRRTWWARDNSRFMNYKVVSFWFKDEIDEIKKNIGMFESRDVYTNGRYIY